MMNRLLLFGSVLFLGSCFNEENVDLARPTTFIKYISDGYNNNAVLVEEVIDPVTNETGFIILANSVIQNTEAEPQRNKVMLIKTDQFGNELWTQYYPPIGVDTARWEGHGLLVLDNGGYLVTGASIKDNKTDLLVMRVDSNGENIASKVFSGGPDASLVGKSATLKRTNFSDNGNYLVLFTSSESNNKMGVAELTPIFDQEWSISRGNDFITSLNNKLFFNIKGDSLLYWSGTVAKTSTSKTDGRLTSNPLKSQLQAGDLDLGDADTDETVNDFCIKGEDTFAFIGTYSKGTNTDIFFRIGIATNNPDTVRYTTQFIPSDKLGNFQNDKNEVGNSIQPTLDGNFIALATIDTYTGVLGRGDTDLLLMKLDPFGDLIWTMPYGSQDADAGNNVKQTSDGGYVILGTTRLAALRTVLLIKTDSRGDVD